MRHLREQTWNWLPDFLAVADAGSIVEASKRLHLTPAAVSRTIRLLESHLGEPVFNRVGRSLVLNGRGKELRNAVREAVTRVDQGLRSMQADPFAGPVRISALGVLTEHFVVPALLDLKARHERIVPELLNLRTLDAVELLSSGQLDVAFYYEELAAEGVIVERLGETSMSVYCGLGHPLFSRKRITRAMMLAHEFSVPQIGDSGIAMDGWPTDLERKVGMRITLLRSNLQVCLSGRLLTVLPDVAAAEYLAQRKLRKLPFRDLPRIEIFAAQPTSAIENSAAREVIEAVRQRIKPKG